MSDKYEYINKTYKLKVKDGTKVETCCGIGEVVGVHNAHLKVRFNEKQEGYFHPTWEMKYYE